MSDYTDVTNQLADQWVAAVERAKDALPNVEEGMKLLPPSFEMPDLAKVLPTGSLIPGVPSPREVVEANYKIAQRLLAAHRDFTLAVIERTTPTGTSAE